MPPPVSTRSREKERAGVTERPREEGAGPESISLARGRLAGEVLEIAAGDAQIGKVAVAQRLELGQSPPVEGLPGKAVPDGGPDAADPFDDRTGGAQRVGHEGHGVSLYSFLLSSVVRQGTALGLRTDKNRFSLMPQVHNAGFRQCCYAANAYALLTFFRPAGAPGGQIGRIGLRFAAKVTTLAMKSGGM